MRARIALASGILLLAVATYSCGHGHEGEHRGAHKDDGGLGFTAPDGSAADRRPIFLVRGWGGDRVADFAQFIAFLEADGVPEADIHEIRYSYLGSMEKASSEVISELERIMATYPDDTKFDVIGNSTGHFLGLYAIMEAHLEQRIDKYIGIAGIGQGLDMGSCRSGICGGVIKKLVPFRSPFVVEFLTKYQDEIAKLQKCSLFSPDDGFISPYDSGAFEGGINVSVPGISHSQAIKKPDYYETMKSRCYGGKFP